MNRPDGLTDLQWRFAQQYVIDLNATAAYKRAGYTVKNDNVASREGFRLLSNPKIQAAIQGMQAKVAERAEVDAARVLKEYVYIALSDLGEIMDFTKAEPCLRPAHDIPERARRAIQAVKVKRHVEGAGEDAREVEVVEFRLWPKNDALLQLGKHLGLIKDRHEHTGRDGRPIQYQNLPEQDPESLTDAQLAAIAAGEDGGEDQPTAGGAGDAAPPPGAA